MASNLSNIVNAGALVSNTNPFPVRFGDGSLIDAFGRFRTSTPITLFDAQQEYGLCTIQCWDGTVYDGSTNLYTTTSPSTNGSISNASGNAVGPRNASTRLTPITVSATSGHYSILQSRQYTRYIPGKSHLVMITGVFAAGSGAAAKLVRRTSTSGSPVDTAVAQADWNIDTFDGTGPSGIILDLTKTQIFMMQAQWLGVGSVTAGFDIEGTFWPAHKFNHANVLTVPYTQTFNLPVRLEGRTGASSSTFRTGYFDAANGFFLETERTTKGGTINLCCCSVQSEGGQEAKGTPHACDNGISTISCNTTGRPVFSLRPAATYNSLTNRAHIELLSEIINVGSGTGHWTIVFGGTLTGASWSAVPSSSCMEFDVSATAVSGGIPTDKGYVSGGGDTARSTGGGAFDTRTPYTLSQIDSLTAFQLPVTVFCQAMTGTVDVAAGFRWYEQTI